MNNISNINNMNNNNYEEEKPMDNRTGCPAVGYQDVNVCIPVTIKPFGEAGNVKTQCLGNPVISSKCDTCSGNPGGVCKFTISQKLRVEVPVIFDAKAEVGEAVIDCQQKEETNYCGPKYGIAK